MQSQRMTVDGKHYLKERISESKNTEACLYREARDVDGRLLFYEYIKMIRPQSPEWKDRKLYK